MGEIFISYRRGDTSPYAGRLSDTLALHFGADKIFHDVGGIAPGAPFPKVIHDRLESCNVLVALIGPHWLTATDVNRRRRLDDPNDFVRQEIRAALGRDDVLVIPVLVDGATMPASDEVPQDLAELTERNAVRLSSDGWKDESAALVRELERVVAGARPRSRPPPTSPQPGVVLGPEVLESWRSVVTAAVAAWRFRGEGSQLDQMLRWGTAIDLRAAERVRSVPSDEGRSRLQVGGRTLTWSEIGGEWERAAGRLVLLGEPGHGKTVAALTLAKHMNAAAGPGKAIAELFPLSEWYRWYAEHPGQRLSAWLADQLTLTYPEIPPVVARALVDTGLVLPLLDGLDEVPASHRHTCKDTIDAYAERSAPQRPFVLTCRAVEYAELAPEWVGADKVVALIGLEPGQITAVLEAETSGRTAWEPVRRRVAEGDSGLLRLFRSPLRLAIALQAYRHADPTELVGLDPPAAKARLWEQLLTLEHPSFGGAGPEQVRSWLTFLAAGMVTNGRQRFWLHDLYVYMPDGRREIRRFATVIRVVVGVAAGLELALAIGPRGHGLVAGLVGGLVAGGFAGLFSRFSVESPSVPGIASLPERLRAARRGVGKSLAVGLVAGLGVGLIGGLQNAGRLAQFDAGTVPFLLLDGLVVALWGGLIGGLIGAAYNMVRAGFSPLTGEPPRQLAGLGPTGVIAASRKNGLVAGSASMLAPMLVGGLGGLVAGRLSSYGLIDGMATGLFFGTMVGLVPGLVVGLGNGLGHWLSHYWLRHRLSRLGLLPADLEAFLDWCALPPRNWLRVSDAYEFRHRDLLDHLAVDGPDRAVMPRPSCSRRWRLGGR